MWLINASSQRPYHNTFHGLFWDHGHCLLILSNVCFPLWSEQWLSAIFLLHYFHNVHSLISLWTLPVLVCWLSFLFPFLSFKRMKCKDCSSLTHLPYSFIQFNSMSECKILLHFKTWAEDWWKEWTQYIQNLAWLKVTNDQKLKIRTW